VKKGFVVDSLPRTGSTTLANLLNCHPDIKCLIEPFHPRRYDGQFHRMALDCNSAEPVLNLMWHRWRGIKHVWEAAREWPLPQKVNDSVILGASRVIVLERRNLLRRYVSGAISRQLDFWIGTRQQFQARLEAAHLKRLDPAVVLQEMEKDKSAVEQRLNFIRENNVPVMHLFYEDIFEKEIMLARQFEIMNKVLGFLGFHEVSESEFGPQWSALLDRDAYQWASPETYRLVPGIEELEREIGSDATGRLFS
jgi:hypothetical protein